MALACAIVLSLFWSLAHSQTFPYVTFMGQTLVNHSYVDLSIKSHYDLIICCSGFGVFNVETGISPVELDCHLLVTFVRVVALKLFLKTMLSHLVVITAVQFAVPLKLNVCRFYCCSTSTTTQEERQSMWDCIVTTKVVISLSVGRSLCELSQPTIRFLAT